MKQHIHCRDGKCKDLTHKPLCDIKHDNLVEQIKCELLHQMHINHAFERELRSFS